MILRLWGPYNQMVLFLHRFETVTYETDMSPETRNCIRALPDLAGEIPIRNSRMELAFLLSTLHQRLQSSTFFAL